MICVVTGGAGFIGSHIVDELIKRGHSVRVIDNESSEVHEQFYHNDRAQYYKVEVSDYKLTRNLFNEVDYVFHLAAESRIQPTLINPLLAFQTNIMGTANVLQCSREAGVKKVIYSSTSSGYGLKNKAPLNEDMPDDCLNPYSVAKVTGERMCKIYYTIYGLKTVTFRYFNVYGDREPTRGQYAPVVGLFLKQKNAGQPLTIVPDGTQRRDFTHIKDVVSANILAMEKDHNNYGEVFNIGTGRNHSILELASMISDKTIMVEPRKAEAYITQADNTKAKTILGWNPTQNIEDYITEKLKDLK